MQLGHCFSIIIMKGMKFVDNKRAWLNCQFIVKVFTCVDISGSFTEKSFILS